MTALIGGASCTHLRPGGESLWVMADSTATEHAHRGETSGPCAVSLGERLAVWRRRAEHRGQCLSGMAAAEYGQLSNLSAWMCAPVSGAPHSRAAGEGELS